MLALAACGGGGNSGGSGGSGGGETSESSGSQSTETKSDSSGSDSGSTETAKEDDGGDASVVEGLTGYNWQEREKIQVRIGMHANPLNSEWGVQTDPVNMMLCDMFNIEMFWINGGDAADWPTRLAAMVAAGDIPDLFLPDPRTQELLLEADLCMEMNQWLSNELTPNVMNDYYWQAAALSASIGNGWGDELYLWPSCLGTWDAGEGALVGDYIRWDLYAQMGYPTIDTKDDLLNVLVDMQEMFPETHDGRKAWSMGFWFGDGPGWGDWPIYYYTHFQGLGAIGPYPWLMAHDRATNDILPLNQLYDKEGVFWSSIWFFNQAHQRGILDPESFIQDDATYNEKLSSHTYYYLIHGWAPSGLQDRFNDDGMPEKGFAWLPGVGWKTQLLQSMMLAGERRFLMHKNTADPERLFAMLDYISTFEFSRIAHNGIEGVYWDFVDGIPTPKPERYNRTVEVDVMREKSGMNTWSHHMGYASATIDPSNGLPVDMKYHPDAMAFTMSAVKKDQLAHYGGNSLFDAFVARLDNHAPVAVFAALPFPDDLSFDQANLSDYTFKNVFNIIRADSNEEYNNMVDAFMADMAQFNVDAMFDFLKESIDAQSANSDKIMALYDKARGR